MNLVEAVETLAMWDRWQSMVMLAGDQYAKSPVFVEQDSQKPEEFDQVADWIGRWDIPAFDRFGRLRDVSHGARTVYTKTFGPLTRQWLDSNTELWFLNKHGLLGHSVLDIGAGYGRLAVSAAPYVKQYWCTDGVPVSRKACQMHVDSYVHSGNVHVLSPAELLEQKPKCEVAVNIHSWNECSFAAIAGWLEILAILKVPYLFTVSHGQLENNNAYLCHQAGTPSFRPLLEEKYDLVEELTLGLSSHPYALWRRK
jgi:hypothetical protein